MVGQVWRWKDRFNPAIILEEGFWLGKHAKKRISRDYISGWSFVKQQRAQQYRRAEYSEFSDGN